MFYRTYRPQTLHELDNKQTRDVLSNILRRSELPHAFLFVGQKGMGKTSAARIVAKAVNCQQNSFADDPASSADYSKKSSAPRENVEPCNTCAHCVAITAGQSPDVIEQDAASNRGIEEIRTLIREASYAPMSGRYRVFIIDEAHMITTDAFNALLKTLEEPPARVLFILATTNEEKIPDTIQSRCVRVSFSGHTRDDVITMLHRILSNEGTTLPDEVLTFIADAAALSFRDATKMLEEVLTQGKTTLQDVEEYFGMKSPTALLALIAQRPNTTTDAKDADGLTAQLQWLEQFHQSGGDVRRLTEDLLSTLQRQLLIQAHAIEKSDNRRVLDLTIPQIAQLMKLVQDAYARLRTAPIPTIPLEIALVEFYNSHKRSS